MVLLVNERVRAGIHVSPSLGREILTRMRAQPFETMNIRSWWEPKSNLPVW